jgi:hypothetical protein
MTRRGGFHWTWRRNDARWDQVDPEGPDLADVADDEGWAVRDRLEVEAGEDRDWYDDLEHMPELPA